MQKRRKAAPQATGDMFVGRVYTLAMIRYVDVPERLTERLDATYVPVKATCNGIAFRGTLSPRGGGRYRLSLNGEVRRAAGRVESGDDVEITLRRTTPHPIPPVPPDLAAALGGFAGGRMAFESWPPGRRRAILGWLAEAKTDGTRNKRIARILDRLGLQTFGAPPGFEPTFRD